MKRYTIECGGARYSQVANDPTDAVVLAFKRRPPATPSILTRCRATGEPWQYISTEAMLKDAGFKVQA